MSGYAPREGQENLMLDIADAIENEDVIIAEAGVGIGKSFAYLIPGLIYSKRTKSPLIISSSSIHLTDQLKGDIEKVSKILSTNFSYVVGKGRTNYLCYSKYISLNEKGDLDHITLQKQWETGFIESKSKKKWSVDKCTFNQCEYKRNCNFYNMRNDLKSNNVDCIVVNHNLLVEDLKKKHHFQRDLIQSGHTIVIDEAHKFEDVVRDSFNLKITRNTITALQNRIKTLNFDIAQNLTTIQKLNNVFEEINSILMVKYKTESQYILGNRLEINEVFRIKSKDIETILWEFNDMKNELRYLEYKDSQENIYYEVEELISTIIEYFKSIPLETSIYWGTYEKTFNSQGFSLYSAPKKINKIIGNILFEYQNSVVLTSATLGGKSEGSIDGTYESFYEYQRNALGLPKATIYSQPQKSPYNYADNTIMYLPSIDIDVRDETEYGKISDEIIKLANLTRGRTLVLFTSKKQLELVHNDLLTKHDRYSWKLIKHDDSKPTNLVKNEFVKEKAVLLSAGTFWEGVNIPGSDLSSLIIVRMPYPVPDPIVQHKAVYNPKVYESEMMIKLKQGTGRLIRSETDFGIIAIFDKRAKENMSIINELPFENITQNIDDVKDFIDKKMTRFLLEEIETI